MTQIIRWLSSFSELWLRRMEEAEGVEEKAVTGTWAIAPFMPGAEEGDAISVFATENESDAERIASALAMRAPGIERYVFASCSRQALEAAGIGLSQTMGLTNNPAIDALHYDMRIPDVDTALIVAKLFQQEVPVIAEKRAVEVKLEAEIRFNKFDFQALAESKSNSAFRDKVFKYVKLKAIQIRGIPTPPPA